jgi:hypothetical protein
LGGRRRFARKSWRASSLSEWLGHRSETSRAV